MGGRRFAQRGHASLTTELLGPVASHAQGMEPRKRARALALAAAIGVALFIATSWLYGPTSRHDSLAEPARNTAAPNLLDNAMSRVQEAVRTVVTRGKVKSRGSHRYKAPNVKKAIVTLPAGAKLGLFEDL